MTEIIQTCRHAERSPRFSTTQHDAEGFCWVPATGMLDHWADSTSSRYIYLAQHAVWDDQGCKWPPLQCKPFGLDTCRVSCHCHASCLVTSGQVHL
jgi:hypothetical protein